MFTRILVPTDFSGASEAALEHARVLASTFGASIHLLHVLPTVFLRPIVNHPHELEAGALRELHDRLTAADRRRFHAVQAVKRSDEPADEIVSYARTHDMDLIVMGTRSGRTHLLMGSVAEKVVRTAPCPVMTVRSAPRLTAAGVRRVLVPTDFSAASDAALDVARLVAVRAGASLHLLHVLEEYDVAPGSEILVGEATDTRQLRLIEAQGMLADRITTDDRARLHATTEVIFGSTARTIVEYAAANAINLIVMGTHGRTGIAHLLIGSVAEQVLRRSECPVVTVRRRRPHEARPAA